MEQSSRIFHFLKVGFVSLLPLAFLLSVFLTNFNTPFRTFDEDNGYLFGGVARSHLLLGLKKTYGQDFFYEGLGKEPIPYIHHPPGVGLSLALILRVLNFGNLDRPFWQERLLPIFYHTGSYFLIFFLSFYFFNSLKAASISSLIFVLMPMSLYYGRIVSHEPPTLFFLALSALLYLRYQAGRRTLYQIGFFASLFFACFYGWPGFYFIPVVLILDFVDYGKKRIKIDKFFWKLVLYEVFLLFVFFGQIFVANGFSFRPTIELIQEKNALPYKGGIFYFKIPWLVILLKRYLRFFTPIVAIPSGVYLFYLSVKKFSAKKEIEGLADWQKMSLLFLVISLIHIFVWRCGSYNLPYWQIYFMPALIFSATHIYLSGEEFLKRLVDSKIWFLPVLLLYYSLIFFILVRQSQPLVWDLYTKAGEFLFPHFYITGF